MTMLGLSVDRISKKITDIYEYLRIFIDMSFISFNTNKFKKDMQLYLQKKYL